MVATRISMPIPAKSAIKHPLFSSFSDAVFVVFDKSNELSELDLLLNSFTIKYPIPAATTSITNSPSSANESDDVV